MDDFLSHYRILCSQRKVGSSKIIPKLVKGGSELICPVESVMSWHWPIFLRTLSTDNSLTKVEFSCNLSPTSQKQTSQKLQKIMDKYYPLPYGCTAVNISNICQAVATMLVHSDKVVEVRLENLRLTKDDILILADSLSCSKIKVLSFAESLIDDESLELLCRKLYHSKIPWLDFSSCQITGERLKSICRLLKYNKNNRTRDMYFLGLRNQTPVLDQMEGINRMTLNNNALGDEGVQMIIGSLEDDFWLKVLDLQKCEIGNEGAQCILKSLKSNVTFQDIDLRQNDIDPSFIERISLQLSLNNAGKELKFRLGRLWKPRQYTVRNPRRIFRTKKVVKTSPPKLKFLPKKPNSSIESAFKFSHAMLTNPKSIEDASVQTEVISVLDEELKKIQRTLTNEIKLRECLMHLLKKYKMENCMLRKEIQKLSKLDDHILIDQDTFSEVKSTFEKFKRFLSVMKEYGLFECIAMLGVNENTDIVLKPLILNATKKCMQLVENEPSSSLDEKEEEEEEEPWLPPDIQAALSQNGTSTCFSTSQKKMEYEPRKELSLVKDKALVQRVYREVRENYSGGRPSFPPKHGRRAPPEATPLRKRPNGRMEAVNKIRQLRSPKEFYYPKEEDSKRKSSELSSSMSDPPPSTDGRPKLKGTTVKRSKPTMDPSSSISSDLVACVHASLKASLEDMAESVCPSGAKSRSYSDEEGTSEKVGTVPSNGTLEKAGVSRSSSNGTLEKAASSLSYSTGFGVGTGSEGKGVSVKSYLESGTGGFGFSGTGSEGKGDSVKSYLESVSDAASTDKDVKSIGDSEVYSAPVSVSKVSPNPSVVSSAKESHNPSVATTMGSQTPSVVSSKESHNPGMKGSQNPSTAKESRNPSMASAKGSPNPSVISAKESRNPSVANAMGSQNPSVVSSKESHNPSMKGKQNPSTAKDSLNPSMVSAKGSQNPSVQTAKGSQNPSGADRSELEDAVAVVDNSISEGAISKSSKRRRAKKLFSQPPLEENLLKKVGSDSSVPSLSDITTVSSRSLNTESVLGQISNEEA